MLSIRTTKKIRTQRILGIDPGIATVGWGVIREEKKQLILEDYGVILTQKNSPDPQRLLAIHRELQKLIVRTQPRAVAVEQIFFYKNVKTAISVSQARGVILLAAAEANLPIKEVTPLEIKQMVTGYGRADKRQIQQMVKILLRLKLPPRPDDAADALAAAISGLRKQQ